MNDLYEPFDYHSDMRLPKKFVDLYSEAKKNARRRLPVLVVKDKTGNQYQIVSTKDKEAAYRKIEVEVKKKFGSSLIEFILTSFQNELFTRSR